MSALVGVPVAAAAWLVTIYKLGTFRRQRRRSVSPVSSHFWGFSFCIAVGMTFMIEEFYQAFDRLAGIPNLAWLIIYVSFVSAIYFIVSGCYEVLKIPRPRLLPYSLLIALMLLIVTYPSGIVTLPEKPDHTIPGTLAEFIFMQVMYVYVGILSLVPFATFLSFYRQETVLSAKLRWVVVMVTTILSSVAGMLKVILTILVFWNPTTTMLAIIYPLIGIALVCTGVLWPMAFLPNRTYLFLARPIEFWDKMRTLRELQALRKDLNRLCPPIIDDKPGWRDSLKDLDFYLYRAVIGILDSKEMLTGLLAPVNAAADKVEPAVTFKSSDVAASRSESNRASVLTQQDKQRAQFLYRTLQAVDDRASFAELVSAYRRVGRVALKGGVG